MVYKKDFKGEEECSLLEALNLSLKSHKMQWIKIRGFIEFRDEYAFCCEGYRLQTASAAGFNGCHCFFHYQRHCKNSISWLWNEQRLTKYMVKPKHFGFNSNGLGYFLGHYIIIITPLLLVFTGLPKKHYLPLKRSYMQESNNGGEKHNYWVL